MTDLPNRMRLLPRVKKLIDVSCSVCHDPVSNALRCPACHARYCRIDLLAHRCPVDGCGPGVRPWGWKQRHPIAEVIRAAAEEGVR